MEYTPWSGIRSCTSCGYKSGKRKDFSNIVPPTNSTKERTYATWCLVCTQKAEAELLKTKCLNRKIERKIEQKKERNKEKEKKYQNYLTKRKEERKLKHKENATIEEKELARRILSRRRLIWFIKRFEPEYKAGWIHIDICTRLEKFLKDAADGKSPRLMIFMPPRHGKSEIVSKKLPAWALGQNPGLEFIAASYAVSLPMVFSRHVRSLLRDIRYKNIFPDTRLDPDNQNVEGWMTTKGGMYMPAGVGGGITGKGADIMAIDDPIKGADEADSEALRDKVWDWYSSEAYTRLSPKSGVIVVQTRWSDDDLSGRLLQQMKDNKKELDETKEALLADIEEIEDETKQYVALKALEPELLELENSMDNWDVVSYPAINDEDEWKEPDGKIVSIPQSSDAKLLRKKGEPLHPARFPLARLKRIKKTLQPRHWSALYQQNPIPEEGLYFKKDMFRYEPVLPDWREWRVIITGDLAIGKNDTNDYTVFICAALDPEDVLHVLDMIRGRWDTFEQADALMGFYGKYSTGIDKPIVGIEAGQLEKALMPVLNKLMREKKAYMNMLMGKQALKPLTDKWVRARPLQGRMQQGMVVFPSNQPWLDTLTHELLRFPGGVHDDIVDAMAWMARVAMNMEPPVQNRMRKQTEKTLKQRLDEYMRKQKLGDVSKHPMAA